MPSCRRKTLLLLALLACTGCNTPLHQEKNRSPLMQARMSPDSVVLDIFSVRFPFADPNVNEKLWQEIDEQQFSPELRERLARNGFRVGCVSGPMPAELWKLLELADKPAPAGDIEGAKVEDLEAKPRVLRQHLQLRAGRPGQIVASEVYAELPVLMCEPGQLRGDTYRQARGVFAVKSLPLPDGWVRLELVPELQYDEMRPPRFVGSQGILRMEAGQPKQEFADMTLAADLAPGTMLILSSLSNRRGSLGHYFFTQNVDGRLEQKLLIVRLSQTQHDGLFNTPEPLKLDE